MSDDIIGKFAYTKRGFFSHIVGKIEKSDGRMLLPYVLVTKLGDRISFRSESDIVFVEIEEE